MRYTKWLLSTFISINFFACTTPEEKASKKESKVFAKKLEKQATIRSEIFFTSSISNKALANRVKEIANLGTFNEINMGLKEGLKQTDIGKAILNSLGKEGKFELVKLYEKENKMHGIFRLFSYESGLNYYDVELIKEENEVKIADFFIYTSNENFSQTMANLIKAKLKNNKDADAYSPELRLKDIRTALNNGRYKTAWDDFNQLPYEFQNTKAAQMMHLQICQNLSDSLYKNAVTRFESLFKNDTCSNLILLDKFVVDKEYDKAIEAINKIDAKISKDPFLDYFRGLMYYSKNDMDKAISCYEKVVLAMPTFSKVYLELISIYTEKDKAKAKLYFEKYSKLSDVKKDEVEKIKSFFGL